MALRKAVLSIFAALVMAGLTQGLMSFLITVFIVLLMIWLFDRGRSPVTKFLFAVIGTNTVGVGSLTAAHLLAGTPDVLQTILPSMLIGTAMTVVYSLTRLRR